MNGAISVNQFETAMAQDHYQRDTAVNNYLQSLNEGTVSDMNQTTQYFTKVAGEYYAAMQAAGQGFIQTNSALSEIGA